MKRVMEVLKEARLDVAAVVATGGAAGPQRLHIGLVAPTDHRRLAAVQPTAPVAVARGSECGAGELLRIQTVRHALRRILPNWQRAGDRLTGELVAETGLIA